MQAIAESSDLEFDSFLRVAPPTLYLKALQARYLLKEGFPIKPLSPDGYKEVMKENEPSTLERLRKHFEELYPRDSVTPEEFYQDYAKELLEEVARAREGAIIADPFTTNLVLRMSSQVQRALEEKYSRKLNDVVVGILPTGRINAMTIHVPSGGDVVAVNEGAVIFLHLICRILSSFVAAGTHEGGMLFQLSPAELPVAISKNKEAVNDFCQVLSVYKSDDETSLGRNLPESLRSPSMAGLNTSQQLLTGFLANAAYHFIIAHEYFHFIAEGPPLGYRRRMLANVQEVDETVHSKEEEISADKGALELVLDYYTKVGEGVDIAIWYSGIELLLCILEIVEESMQSRLDTDSYPKATERREYLRQWLRQRYGDRAQAAILAGSYFEDLILRLKERCKSEGLLMA